MSREDDGTTATADPATAAPEDSPPSAAADGGAGALQEQLREKEQLITALTERLEQAAEQLDRLRRTGADKGRRPVVGGIPAELVEEHKQTIDELKRVITNWEDMQAGVTLGRIETQIGELRDMLAGYTQMAVAGAPPRTAASRETAPAPRPASPPADAGHAAAKPGGNSWWEKQKAALLGEGAAESEPAQAQPGPASETPAPAGESPPAEQAPAAWSPPANLQVPDLPAPVDFENISLEDAKQAIRVRDEIILQLREPLVTMVAAGQIPRDLVSLDQLPEPVRQRFAELEAQWQARFRQTELELSIERARLAREQAQLHQQQEQIQKQLKRAGRESKPASEPAGKPEDGQSRRRWFRFMGKTDGSENEGGES